MGSIPIISTIIIIKIKVIRRISKRRPFQQKKGPQTRINEYIRALEVRVVSDSGEQLGLMSSDEALRMAKEQELDLVEIAPLAKPPVCKIMDFGKFQYQQSKQDKNNKAKQKKSEIKGIRIGVRTDDHDLDFKKEQAEKFLQKGNKIKIEITLRGREKAHQDLAKSNLEEFVKNITTPNKIEQEIKRFPGGFNTIIAPQ